MPAVYQDLVNLNLPEWKIGEIVNGRLCVRRLPLPKGTMAFSALLFLLADALEGAWRILPRVELCLGDDVLVPDLSGWRHERMPVVPNTAWIELPPDWVCDVLTPSSLTIVREQKAAAYARHGISDWWVIDPDKQAVEVHALRGNAYECAAHLIGRHALQSPPFANVAIDLGHLWP